MRASVRHPLRRRHPWRERPAKGERRPESRPRDEPDGPAERGRYAVPDPAVLRVRRAGGPLDEACYTCRCGYVFVAPVSTTVSCPRCDADQPW
jgi:hypothetical protein